MELGMSVGGKALVLGLKSVHKYAVGVSFFSPSANFIYISAPGYKALRLGMM
jgi:hypothetical protein